MQHTLAQTIELQGIGLHSGAETVLRLRPAGLSHGIRFIRVDVNGKDNVIAARWDCVTDTRLCTVVANQDGVSVGTIEHLMAALAACAIDNADIELDGPEIPIMDGSAQPFVDAILRVGVKTQAAPRRAIRILKPVSIIDGDKKVVLRPGIGSEFQVDIDFPHPEIGRQMARINLIGDEFFTKIARARTFGFLHEVTALRAMGLALGGSMENAIVLDQDSIMNPEGLRSPTEFARHKLLDAVGDIYLAGAPILGVFEGVKPGHQMNNLILHELFAHPECWSYVDLYMDQTQIGQGSQIGSQLESAAELEFEAKRVLEPNELSLTLSAQQRTQEAALGHVGS